MFVIACDLVFFALIMSNLLSGARKRQSPSIPPERHYRFMIDTTGHAVHARDPDQDRLFRLHDKLSRELGREVCACLSDASVIEILLMRIARFG